MKKLALRPIVFWSHLVTGVSAGLLIFLMSATGVLLTYERQIKAFVDSRYTVSPPGEVEPLSVDAILARFQHMHPGEDHFYIRFINRPHAAVAVWAGSDNGYLVDPYTGAVLRDGVGATGVFFYVVTALHRWLGIESKGKGSGLARAITGWSNVVFVFLIISGIWLWWPRLWRWPVLKAKLLFNRKLKAGRARHFNWHQVFSAWALIPLLCIAISGLVISFPWASSMLYGLYGEEVPDRSHDHETTSHVETTEAMTQQTLYDIAIGHAVDHGAGDWYSVWVEPGEASGDPVEYYIDRSIGHRPWLAYELTLDSTTGEVLEYKPLAAYSKGDQAWDYMRFLHTGEVYGFIGQTVAGLASLAACVLVYTGLALAWRRLITPRLARSKLKNH